jgi:Na+/H+ antiporter NhaD/arsenite permease-like protein
MLKLIVTIVVMFILWASVSFAAYKYMTPKEHKKAIRHYIIIFFCVVAFIAIVIALFIWNS